MKPGLYEQVINRLIAAELKDLPEKCRITERIDTAEAPQVLAQYLSEIIRRALESQNEEGKKSAAEKLAAQVELADSIIERLCEKTGNQDFRALKIGTGGNAEQLLALLQKDDIRLNTQKIAELLPRPETSIARSSLFTGTAKNEPRLGQELRLEIESADRIDMLVSFIKWSGIRTLRKELENFTEHGGKLRIITTTYTGATDARAVQTLSALKNTEIRVSYDTKSTRLHAKAYIFHRDNGFTTAYVGSSNLSGAAVSDGLEWNVKITAQDLPDTIRKIESTFESYMNSPDFEPYEKERFEAELKEERRHVPAAGTQVDFSVFDIRPHPFQKEILDKLESERVVLGRNKNLIVAATGTGKTVVSAFDYRRFCEKNPRARNRLLFVAHRREILDQSLTTFRAILKNPNFGERFVGGDRPRSLEHLFVSVQSANSQEFCEKLPADFYDFIIVDEFHHAAAATYRKLLTHFRPKQLLGLTATPERADGENIVETYFDGNIAAEIRLPEAIERELLCPFQYFGVSDTVDLDSLRWSRGGYDEKELSAAYTVGVPAKNRVAQILDSIRDCVTDIGQVKGLGFCVSVEHANFMTQMFERAGIPSVCVCGNTPDDERRNARERLANAADALRFIFTVDVYNEGIDIPEVNTVLFLRPTESLTIFLQQLGRGLRLSPKKECLTVLDFIGAANRKYNFEEKLAALLAGTHCNVAEEVKRGFPSVPHGCFVRLEKKASDIVLANIRHAVSRRDGLFGRIRTFEEDTGKTPTLTRFVRRYRMDLRTLYSVLNGKSFARACADAGTLFDFREPAEEALSKAFLRLACADSPNMIFALEKILTPERLGKTGVPADMTPQESTILKMFYRSVWDAHVNDWRDAEAAENLRSLAQSPILLGELRELLKLRKDAIAVVPVKPNLGFDCPLEIHSNYTRDQILSAMGFAGTVREGVKWLPDKRCDLLFVTLNKSEKDYSPTTMYNDYSVDETHFHWQSQSTTSEVSPTGQRYIRHRELGSKILLFVREAKTDGNGRTAPYTFLGTANYVSHTGSRPMNITWELDTPIPAKYLRDTNTLLI